MRFDQHFDQDGWIKPFKVICFGRWFWHDAILQQGCRTANQVLLALAQAPKGASDLPAVDALRRTWMLEYIREEGRSRWRNADEIGPASERFNSPYDTDAHHGVKGSRNWDGYKVHLTETCDANTPNLITHVMTTGATLTDVECTQVIEEALISKGLQPGEHVVDGAYVSAALLVSSQKRGTSLIGPARPMQGW